MSLLEAMHDEFDIQQGLNASFINILEILAMTIATKLPVEDRADFASIIEKMVDHEPYTNDLTAQGKQAYKSVCERIASTILLAKQV